MPRPPKQKVLLVHSITPDQLLRSGLAVACDLANQIIQTCELFSNPELPTASFELLVKSTRELAEASLGALVEIEKSTRPTLQENADAAYLKSLFNLPDTRKESPLEQ